jgi:WD40 repeat protein
MPDKNPRPNPYIGPRAFQTGETLYGRDVELRQLMDLLVAERVVLMHSPSGAGKTSLIRAGLVPLLSQQGFYVFPIVRVNQDVPDSLKSSSLNRYLYSAMASLESEESAAADDSSQSTAQDVLQDQFAGLSFAAYLDRLAQQRIPQSDDVGFAYREGTRQDEVIIFDQFEEILTISPADQESKQVFFDQISEALRDRHRWVLFAMREDYAAALAPYLRPIPTRLRNRFRLDLLTADEAMQAIRKPVEQVGAAFTSQAAERLVNDLRMVQEQRPDGSLVQMAGPYVEPVQLQVVCHRLWRNLDPDDVEITEEDIANVGDVNQSLAEYYAESLTAVAAETGASERKIREWFQNQLITEQGIRSQVIMGAESSEGLPNPVIQHLLDTHLVRAEKRRGVTWFELAHDRLVDPVLTNNQAWFEANLSLLQRQARLWEKENRPANLLLLGQDLANAETWAATHPDELEPIEVEFLETSRQAHEEEERAKAEQAFRLDAAQKLAEAEKQRAEEQTLAASRLRQRLWISIGLLVLAVGFGIIAWIFWTSSQAAAVKNAQLADTNATNAALAQAASTEAVGNAATAQINEERAQAASTQAVVAQKTAVFNEQEALAQKQIAEQQARRAQSGQLAALSAASFLNQPQSSLLLAVESLQVSRQSGEQPPIISLQNMYNALANAGGKVLPGAGDEIWSVDVSQDGRWVAAGGKGTQVYLWEVGEDFSSSKIHVLEGHTDSISGVRFIPGKPWLASASRDGTLRLWNLEALDQNGSPQILPGHTESIDTLAASSDGHWLASGGRDNRAILWDVSGLEAKQALTFDHRGDVTSLDFSPDGKFLASGSTDNQVIIWSLAPPTRLPVASLPHDDDVLTLAYNADGTRLASGSKDGVVMLWNLQDADPAASGVPLREHSNEVRAVAFSEDGNWLATSSIDNNVILYDLRSGSPPTRYFTLRGHFAGVGALDFTPDNQWLISGSIDDTMMLWNLGQSDPGKDPLTMRGHEGAVRDLRLASDGTRLLSGSVDGTVRMWDLRAPSVSANPVLLSGAEGQVQTVNFSPDGNFLVSAGKDNEAFLWDLTSADPVTHVTVLKGHTNDLSSALFSPDGHWLATAGGDQRVLVWDFQDRIFTQPHFTLAGHDGRVTALAFVPDSSLLLSSSRDETVRLWDLNLPDPGQAPVVLQGHSGDVLSLAVDPQGRFAASGDNQGDILVWDLASGSPQQQFTRLQTQQGAVQALQFSPDGKWLAAGIAGGEDCQSDCGPVLIWQVDSAGAHDPVELASHSKPVEAVSFSPDNQWLASASQDGSAHLYRLPPSTPLAAPYVLPSLGDRTVHTLAFTPDSRWLAMGSADNHVRLWNLAAATPNSEVIDLPGGREVWALGIDPGGKYLASGNRDRLVHLWDLNLADLINEACLTAGRNFTANENSALFPSEPDHKTCPQWP